MSSDCEGRNQVSRETASVQTMTVTAVSRGNSFVSSAKNRRTGSSYSPRRKGFVFSPPETSHEYVERHAMLRAKYANMSMFSPASAPQYDLSVSSSSLTVKGPSFANNGLGLFAIFPAI